jgi:hypothetical protein
VYRAAGRAEEIRLPGKFLCVLTPGILGAQYFREVRELLTAGGPPDPAKMGAIMMRHGLVPAKPA